MTTTIRLNGRTYIITGRRIQSYRMDFWGQTFYRNVSSQGLLGKKLLALATAQAEG